MDFLVKILQSIVTSDLYILIFACATVVCLLISYLAYTKAKSEMKTWEKESDRGITRYIYTTLTIPYTVFVTLISIFPLLGMFGTVKSLLSLDFATEEALLIARNSFFDALTSTVWGIIFAVMFKLINALVSTRIESTITKLTELVKKFDEQEVTTAKPHKMAKKHR